MITESHLKILIRINQIEPIKGKVLCLGRQRTLLKKEELEEVFRQVGVIPHPLYSEALSRGSEDDEKCPSKDGCLSDHQVFAALGVTDLHSMDVSDFEGANIIHNLNDPIPENLVGQFNFIVDGGTFDHLIDIKTAFINLIKLLSPTGRTFMWNAASNFNPLCYLAFSPEFFHDYFLINNFEFCKTCLAMIDHPAQREWWDIYQFVDLKNDRRHFTSSRLGMVLVYAKKQPNSTFDKIPIQEYYRTHISYNLENRNEDEKLDPFVGSKRRRTIKELVEMFKSLRYSFGKIGVVWKGRI